MRTIGLILASILVFLAHFSPVSSFDQPAVEIGDYYSDFSMTRQIAFTGLGIPIKSQQNETKEVEDHDMDADQSSGKQPDDLDGDDSEDVDVNDDLDIIDDEDDEEKDFGFTDILDEWNEESEEEDEDEDDHTEPSLVDGDDENSGEDTLSDADDFEKGETKGSITKGQKNCYVKKIVRFIQIPRKPSLLQTHIQTN